MEFVFRSSGHRKLKSAPILIPGCPTMRVEREFDGLGWVVSTQDREFGWLWGDLVSALADARSLAGQRSSAWGAQ